MPMESDMYTLVPRNALIHGLFYDVSISDQISRGPAGRAAAEPLSGDLLLSASGSS